MIALIVLSKEGRIYISPQNSRQDESKPRWTVCGESIESVSGSFCGSAFCVINGELFASRVDKDIQWRRSSIRCSSAFIGGSSIVIKTGGKGMEKCAFDPIRVEPLSEKKQLPLAKQYGIQASSHVMVGPRDHVLTVNSKGETFLLREEESDDGLGVWIPISAAPPDEEVGRGIVGRAASFLRNLTGKKDQYFGCVCLCANSVWACSTSKPALYQLDLGDPDVLANSRNLLEWTMYDIEDKCRVVRLCGSPRDPLLWGLDEKGRLKRYVLERLDRQWVVRSSEMPIVLNKSRVKCELVDVCVSYASVGSSHSSPTTATDPNSDSDEEFVEALPFAHLGHLKYATRYCCPDGSCDMCLSMKAAADYQPTGHSMEITTTSSGAILLSPRKRPPQHSIQNQQKKTKSCLNKYYLLEGVSLGIYTPTAIDRARQLQSDIDVGSSGPILNPISEIIQEPRDTFEFALEVMSKGGEHMEPLAPPLKDTPLVSAHHTHLDTINLDQEVFFTATDHPSQGRLLA